MILCDMILYNIKYHMTLYFGLYYTSPAAADAGEEASSSAALTHHKAATGARRALHLSSSEHSKNHRTTRLIAFAYKLLLSSLVSALKSEVGLPTDLRCPCGGGHHGSRPPRVHASPVYFSYLGTFANGVYTEDKDITEVRCTAWRPPALKSSILI